MTVPKDIIRRTSLTLLLMAGDKSCAYRLIYNLIYNLGFTSQNGLDLIVFGDISFPRSLLDLIDNDIFCPAQAGHWVQTN